MRMSRLAAAVLPMAVYRWLQEIRQAIKKRRFFLQGHKYVPYANYLLKFPSHHPLLSIIKTQPLKDFNVGVVAKYVGSKYPNKLVIDIGANVGDTGAIIASSCQNRILLVEGSSFFYQFLVENAKLFGERARSLQCLIGSGETVTGELRHWGGTAYFDSQEDGTAYPTYRLDDLVDEDVCLVKIDVDGFELDIVLGSIDFFAKRCSAIMFESTVLSLSDAGKCESALVRLRTLGYCNYIVWDDPGFYIMSTTDLHTVGELNRYLGRMWSMPKASKSISNYDILCLHRDDTDVFESIKEYYGAY